MQNQSVVSVARNNIKNKKKKAGRDQILKAGEKKHITHINHMDKLPLPPPPTPTRLIKSIDWQIKLSPNYAHDSQRWQETLDHVESRPCACVRQTMDAAGLRTSARPRVFTHRTRTCSLGSSWSYASPDFSLAAATLLYTLTETNVRFRSAFPVSGRSFLMLFSCWYRPETRRGYDLWFLSSQIQILQVGTGGNTRCL